MEIIGIICEYNPFHNGHLYHIKKIKELYPDSLIIACISSSFCERGDVSIMNKWDKTEIALNNEIDLVVELPFVYSTQSADIFSKGALQILNSLHINKLIFGSESNDIESLTKISKTQINNKVFDSILKEYLNQGNNYPTSISKALKELKINYTNLPNDLLGISYIKEILKNKYKITPITIKRTNDFHGNNKGIIKSASEIRDLLNNNKNIKKYINYNKKILYRNTDYFNLLKYKINSEENISKYQTVDEGIESRIKKYINSSNNLEELIINIKNKRFTYNKINRMLIHILTSLTKEEAKYKIDYIRLLGFNQRGRQYLKENKKNIQMNIITSYKESTSQLLTIEKRITYIYSQITHDKKLIERETKKPILK
jgi:predicted nucleotidyltransferase